LDARDTDGEEVWRIENFWVSPCYGAKIESKKLVFTARIKGDFQIRNVFKKESSKPPSKV
jgi:hypothetical protein